VCFDDKKGRSREEHHATWQVFAILARRNRKRQFRRAGSNPRLPFRNKPSIAVLLAIHKHERDPEQDYFALMEWSRTSHGGLSSFQRRCFVIARNSSFHIQGAPRFEAVWRELGVRLRLEGSVSQSGKFEYASREQLVDTPRHLLLLWGDRLWWLGRIYLRSADQ